MRAIFTGWRRWNDPNVKGSEYNTLRLWAFMDHLWAMVQLTNRPSLQIVVGDAAGSDEEVANWAAAKLLEAKIEDPRLSTRAPELIMFRADWDRLGKAAGPVRNQAMVTSGGDLGVAFPHPDSRGTWDCVDRMRAAKIHAIIVPWVNVEESKDEVLRAQPWPQAA